MISAGDFRNGVTLEIEGNVSKKISCGMAFVSDG